MQLRTERFLAFVSSTVDELLCRGPELLGAREIFVSNIEVNAMLALEQPKFEILPEVFEMALSYFRSRAIRVFDRPSLGAPLSRMIGESIADAALFAAGRLTIEVKRRSNVHASNIQNLLRSHASGGQRYFVRPTGHVDVIVLGSLGVPPHTWAQFITDGDHDFRIVMADYACAGLFDGMLHRPGSIQEDADVILNLIEAEGLDNVVLVGWSNACTIAVDVALRARDKVSSLVLLAPSFSGPMSHVLTNFEKSLNRIFDDLLERGQSALPDDFAEKAISAQRAGATVDEIKFLSLPALSGAKDLLTPLAASSAVSYALRARSDQAYPILSSLSSLRTPTLLVTGTCDQIVSNPRARDLLLKSGIPFFEACVSGAGHYIHDLQYTYFIYLLTWFTQRAELSSSKRICVRSYAD